MTKLKCILSLTIIALVSSFSSFAADATSDGWVSLFNGKDKTQWRPQFAGKDGWIVKDGILINILPSGDIISNIPQGDCEMHVEFMVPKGSNSGIYLQGRYEIQVLDSAGFPVQNTISGAIYGMIAPKVNAAKPAGEWQTFDVIFHQAVLDATGKKIKNARVTIVYNGIKAIDDAELDRPTPAGVDDKEGKPAGLMLQGDHGPVQFRSIKIRPL